MGKEATPPELVPEMRSDLRWDRTEDRPEETKRSRSGERELEGARIDGVVVAEAEAEAARQRRKGMAPVM